MANLFVSLPVPAGNGAGAWVDTSGMAAGKTISVDGGTFSGTLYLESSNDGQTSAGPVDCRTFKGGDTAPAEIAAATQWMRVRRDGGVAPFGSPSVKVAAPAASGNVFAGMAVPAADGAGAGTDLSAGGDVNTLNIVGPFSGAVYIDISTDGGATWSPALLVGLPGQTTNGSAVGTNVLGVLSQARVRRVGVLAGVAAPIVSVGSSTLAGGGGATISPYDLDPENVDNLLIGPGVSADYARGDHVHGLTFSGDTVPQDVEGPGGTPSDGISPFPAREDHVHVLAGDVITGYLSEIYALGLADDPVADNTLVGTYFSTYFDNVDVGLKIFQSAPTSGADFDAHPALLLNRHFITFPSAALVARFQAQYDVSDRTQGGSYFAWALANAGGTSSDYATMLMDFRTQGAIGYTPNVLPSGSYTELRYELANRRGFGNTTRLMWNSDGLEFRSALFDTVTPQLFYGDIRAIDSAGVGLSTPANGSAFAYTVAASMLGPDVPGKLALASFIGVLDQQLFGSGEAVGHAEIWTTPAPLGSSHQKAVAFDFPQSTFQTDLNTLGDLGADGDLDVIGAAAVGDLTVGGAPVGQAGVSLTVDLLAAVGTSYAINLPVVPGKKLVGCVGRFLWVSRTGVATGNAQVSVGNNVTFDNYITAAGGQINIATINTAVADTTTAIGGGNFAVDMSTTALKVAVALNPTGVTAATGKVILIGVYV